ncbi:MAG TPA: outer membrane protein [Salinarimonas sp.]|nr:outer membrane protein [Salinarimonas sp.]
MRSLTLRALAAASVLGLALPAAAADLLPPPPMMPEPAVPVADIGSGWYLRGDIGYVAYNPPTDVAYGILTEPSTRMKDEKLESTWSIGIGAGYRLNSWLRVDGTVDYRFGTNFSGLTSGTAYVHGYSVDRANLTSTTFLANAYVDLGTWSGITPYVGAGVGYARTELDGYTTQIVCITATCGHPGPQAVRSMNGGVTSGLAWALMAGVGIDLGHGAVLDLGYRYVNLGGVQTKLRDGIGTKLADLDAHEARIGLRWQFGAPAAVAVAPVAAPGYRPIVARN